MPQDLTISAVVATRIRDARRARRWSQQDLVNALAEHGHHVTATTICSKETGRRASISVDLLVAASHALDIPVTELLGINTHPPTPTP